jgi:hypothetical protein
MIDIDDLDFGRNKDDKVDLLFLMTKETGGKYILSQLEAE